MRQKQDKDDYGRTVNRMCTEETGKEEMESKGKLFWLFTNL